jgi:hypothetical protein
MQTIELPDGGILLYDDAFLPSDVAARYFVELRESASWEQMPGVFGSHDEVWKLGTIAGTRRQGDCSW